MEKPASRFGRSFFAIALLLGSAPFSGNVAADTVVYENGEQRRGTWQVYDKSPPGARVTFPYNAARGGRVVRLDGDGIRNGYMLGGVSAETGGWNDVNGFVVSWRQRAAVPFRVYVAASTTKGLRYFFYTDISASFGLMDGRYVHHGLGPGSRNGAWQTMERDLLADLESVEPDNVLLAVHGFLARGDILLDDITLSDECYF